MSPERESDRGMPSMTWPSYAAHRTICERSEEHTSELQSRLHLVCRLLLEKKKKSRTLHGQRAERDHLSSLCDERIIPVASARQQALINGAEGGVFETRVARCLNVVLLQES